MPQPKLTWPEPPKPDAPDPWAAAPAPPDLLEPEYAPAVRAYRTDPTPETAAPVLAAVRPVIDEALKSYAGTEAPTATARARAKVLTLQAVARYDPARAKLRTHLLSHLRGLRRTAERSTAGVYVPEQWRIDARKVDAAYADARDELGREPSDAELADRVGLPLVRVRRARAVPGVLSGSQAPDAAVDLTRPDERAWNRWVDGIYHDVDPVDQTIMDHSLGLHGRAVLPANRIAELVNLSPGAVSQRKARIQKQLDEFESFTYGSSR